MALLLQPRVFSQRSPCAQVKMSEFGMKVTSHVGVRKMVLLQMSLKRFV